MLEELKTQMAFVCQEILPPISYDKRLTVEVKTLRGMVMSIDTATFGLDEETTDEETPKE